MSEAFEQPTMACPKCGMELEDFDGFGVLAHITPMPKPCGYCTHPSAEVVDDANGISKCGLCSRLFDANGDIEPEPKPIRSGAAPMRETVNIVEVPGERGGTHVVHVLSCGHWLSRRKASKRLRCVGCAIELALANEPGVTAAGPGPVALQAVIAGIEGALGEIVRQGGPDYLVREARGAGLLAARPFLNVLGEHGKADDDARG